MKKFTIEMDDDLSAVYEDIAKMYKRPTEETLQVILRRLIESMLAERPHSWPE